MSSRGVFPNSPAMCRSPRAGSGYGSLHAHRLAENDQPALVGPDATVLVAKNPSILLTNPLDQETNHGERRDKKVIVKRMVKDAKKLRSAFAKDEKKKFQAAFGRLTGAMIDIDPARDK